MKKVLIFMILFLIVSGCSKDETLVKEETIEEKTEAKEDVYIDDNPIVIGIYENDIKLVKEYKTSKTNDTDLIFSVFYTNEDYLDNKTQKYNWNKYFNQYTNINKYKIGYSISFYVGNEKVQKTILEPDTFAFNPYFYIYLYDDINQPDGTFYSHLETSDVNENTIFSSIKLYLVEVDKITSPIVLTAFTYDGIDDFDDSNVYRGNSKYSITINFE